MKKKYEALEIEIVQVHSADIITSSPGTETPIVPDDTKPGNIFSGGFDIDGWT